MNKSLIVGALLGLYAPSALNAQIFSQVESSTTNNEVTEFTKGFLRGLFAKEYGIEGCMQDTSKLSEYLESSFTYFDKETFDDVLKGLTSLGYATEEMNFALQNCQFTDEPSIITDLSNVFQNPNTVNYQVGQSLLLNGQEIYPELSIAISNWRANAPLFSGESVGTAYQFVYFNDKTAKTQDVSETYDFLFGFMQTSPDNYGVTNSDLYNNMNTIGTTFIDYIRKGFEDQEAKETVYKGISYFGDAFINGAPILEDASAITDDSEEKFVTKGQCLQAVTEDKLTEQILQLYTQASGYYDEGALEECGNSVGQLANLLCPAPTPDTLFLKQEVDRFSSKDEEKKFESTITESVEKITHVIKEEAKHITQAAKDFAKAFMDQIQQRL